MVKYLITFLCVHTLGYLVSQSTVIDSPAENQLTINWPSEYQPSKSKFFVHNEIEIKANPEVVWGLLIDAEAWESWYPGAKDVKILNPEKRMLHTNARFLWKTMGLSFESVIKEFEPNRVLAWESKKKSIRGYHVWLIIPTKDGCQVITDESQNGGLTFFEKTFQKNKLKKLHDIWLLELKRKSENNE